MATKTAGRPADGKLPNILIVDDRKENLLVTEKVLKTLPAHLFTATSGNEALSMMLRNRFAVVILDGRGKQGGRSGKWSRSLFGFDNG